MATVPSLYTWQKEQPTWRDMKSRVEDVLNWCMDPPMVRLRQTTAQNLNSSAVTPIVWDLVEVENDEMWTSTTATRLKPTTAGWYVGTCSVSFEPNTNGYREIDVRKNNNGSAKTIRLKHTSYAQAGITVVTGGAMFLEQFNGTTDYIEVTAWQNTGVVLATIPDVIERQPTVALKWYCPL